MQTIESRTRSQTRYACALGLLLATALVGNLVIPAANAGTTATTASFPGAIPGYFWTPLDGTSPSNVQEINYGGGSSSSPGLANSDSPCVVPDTTASEGETNYFDFSPFNQRTPKFRPVGMRLARRAILGLQSNLAGYSSSGSGGPPRGRLHVYYAAQAGIYRSSNQPMMGLDGTAHVRWLGNRHPKHYRFVLVETVLFDALGPDVSKPAVSGYLREKMSWRSGRTPETGFQWTAGCPDFTPTGDTRGLQIALSVSVRTPWGEVSLQPLSAQRIANAK